MSQRLRTKAVCIANAAAGLLLHSVFIATHQRLMPSRVRQLTNIIGSYHLEDGVRVLGPMESLASTHQAEGGGGVRSVQRTHQMSAQQQLPVAQQQLPMA